MGLSPQQEQGEALSLVLGMTVDEGLGPYLNDDGDWWVPATIPYLLARRIVEGCLPYSIPDDGTLVYKGRVRTHLCQERHDDPAECGGDCSPAILAYHWEENRKW